LVAFRKCSEKYFTVKKTLATTSSTGHHLLHPQQSTTHHRSFKQITTKNPQSQPQASDIQNKKSMNNHPVTHKSQQPPQQSPTSPDSKNPQIATTTTKTHITGVEKATNRNNKIQQIATNHHNKNPYHRYLKTHKP
jgi:hypothetical protein